jgi:hypothetical protein
LAYACGSGTLGPPSRKREGNRAKVGPSQGTRMFKSLIRPLAGIAAALAV